MGNKSAKKTNEMLGQQTTRSNAFADTMGSRGAEDRDYSTGSRGKIDQAYWDLYGGIGAGGGGGGGYRPMETIDLNWNDPRANEAMAGYRNLRDTGGWSAPEMADFRARASSGQGGFFEGIKNQLSAAQAGGGSVGYGSQMAKLARDAGRSLGESQLNAETDLQSQIRAAKERGLGGVERLDESLIGREGSVEEKRNNELLRRLAARNANISGANAAAGRRAGAASDAFREKMSILGELRGLRGEGGSDLAYADRQLAGLGQAAGTVSNRVNEPGFFDRAMQLGGLAAGVAAPFINPGRRRGSSGGGQNPGMYFGGE